MESDAAPQPPLEERADDVAVWFAGLGAKLLCAAGPAYARARGLLSLCNEQSRKCDCSARADRYWSGVSI